MQWENLRGQGADLLVNKIVPVGSDISVWPKMKLAEDRHTGTEGGGLRRAGGHSGRHYRTTQTEELREASCFLGPPEPLNATRFSTNLGGLDDKKQTPLWHLDKEKFLAFLGLRDVGRDEWILPRKLALTHNASVLVTP